MRDTDRSKVICFVERKDALTTTNFGGSRLRKNASRSAKPFATRSLTQGRGGKYTRHFHFFFSRKRKRKEEHVGIFFAQIKLKKNKKKTRVGSKQRHALCFPPPLSHLFK